MRMDPEFVSTLIAEREQRQAYHDAYADARARMARAAMYSAGAANVAPSQPQMQMQMQTQTRLSQASVVIHPDSSLHPPLPPQSSPLHGPQHDSVRFVYANQSVPDAQSQHAPPSAAHDLPAGELSCRTTPELVTLASSAVPSSPPHDFYGWDALDGAQSSAFLPILLPLDAGAPLLSESHPQPPLDPADLALAPACPPPHSPHPLPQFLFAAQPFHPDSAPPSPPVTQLSPASPRPPHLEVDEHQPEHSASSLVTPLPPAALLTDAHASASAASSAGPDGSTQPSTEALVSTRSMSGRVGSSLLKQRSQSLVPAPFRFALAAASAASAAATGGASSSSLAPVRMERAQTTTDELRTLAHAAGADGRNDETR
jgi:hypothetical protein